MAEARSCHWDHALPILVAGAFFFVCPVGSKLCVLVGRSNQSSEPAVHQTPERAAKTIIYTIENEKDKKAQKSCRLSAHTDTHTHTHTHGIISIPKSCLRHCFLSRNELHFDFLSVLLTFAVGIQVFGFRDNLLQLRPRILELPHSCTVKIPTDCFPSYSNFFWLHKVRIGLRSE